MILRGRGYPRWVTICCAGDGWEGGCRVESRNRLQVGNLRCKIDDLAEAAAGLVFGISSLSDTSAHRACNSLEKEIYNIKFETGMIRNELVFFNFWAQSRRERDGDSGEPNGMQMQMQQQPANGTCSKRAEG